MTAWLMMAVSGDRAHAGNEGYADLPSDYYSWDDTVVRFDQPKPGDQIALWDKETLLGVSIIDRIDEGTAVKIMRRCPKCGQTSIKPRKTKVPLYKCQTTGCGFEFDVPVMGEKEVRTYRSFHSRMWRDLTGVLTGAELRTLCEHPKDQSSLRHLHWDDFIRAANDKEPDLGLEPIDEEAHAIPGGFRRMETRVRIGQGLFRARLLDRYGEECALTGPSILGALDAAHIVQYATTGIHHESEGLLLRKDLHALVDRKLIGLDPSAWRVRVSPYLYHVPTYRELDGSPLLIPRLSRLEKALSRLFAEYSSTASR